MYEISHGPNVYAKLMAEKINSSANEKRASLLMKEIIHADESEKATTAIANAMNRLRSENPLLEWMGQVIANSTQGANRSAAKIKSLLLS